MKVVNNESLFISWAVGQYVSTKLLNNEWGSKVVTLLSEYLRTKDPSLKGYSRSNIYNMVSFFENYTAKEFLDLLASLKTTNKFVQTNSAQLYPSNNQTDEIVQTNSGQFIKMQDMPEILLLATGAYMLRL